MRDRKLFFLFIGTILFAIGVILWYFFGATPKPNTTNETPTNPFGDVISRIPGMEFVTKGNSEASTSTTETEVTDLSEQALFQVWDKPVAGYSFITRDIIIESTSTEQVATSTLTKKAKPVKQIIEYGIFADRITGHIYGYDFVTHSTFQITNTTVPGIYDAYFTGNGARVYMRYLDKDGVTIHTITGTLPPVRAGLEPKPLGTIVSLQENITSFAVADSSNTLSYLVPNQSGSTVYTINQKGSLSLVTSPFREWSLMYGGELPYMMSKPSAYVEGSILSLPNKQYILGGKTGLISAPSQTGATFLSSMWTDSGLATFLFTKKTAATQLLDIQTLASKCTWLSESMALCGVPESLQSDGREGLPDEWFQGTLSFSDDMYLVYTNNDRGNTSLSSLLFSLHLTDGGPFDMTRLRSNPTASSLLFTNKRDGTLWFADLSKMIRD